MIAIDKDYNLMVGLRIREIRETLHLSREKFSEKCDISPSFLFDVESGKKSVTAKTIYKIATACNVSADYIVLGHNTGFESDLILELLGSFTPQQREHALNILTEFQKAITES